MQPGRNKKGIEKKALILDTVLKMVATGGVDSVTHRRVAENARVPLGLTTYYFDSREHLIEEAFDQYIRVTRSSMDGLFELEITTIQELTDILVNWVAREFESPSLLLAEYEMVLYAARNKRIATVLEEWDEAMGNNLARSLESMGAHHAKRAASVLITYIRGYELLGLSREMFSADRFRGQLELFLSTLIAGDQ